MWSIQSRRTERECGEVRQQVLKGVAGVGLGLMVELLPGVHKALSWMPTTEKEG